MKRLMLECGGNSPNIVFDDYPDLDSVADGVLSSMTVAREEIFGPVLSVLEFDTVDEAIRIANDTIYGLSATVWTRSLETMHRVARDLRAGQIVVRSAGTASPGAKFGALPLEPHGQSGIGVEGGCEGLNSYTVLKSM